MMDKYTAPGLMASSSKTSFHIMAKPGGAACNMDCAYCFYLSKQTLAGGLGAGRMSDEVLEAFIRRYIEGVTADEVVFSWQGGEPTLLGLDFFRKVVELERKYARPGQRIENDLQTNGTLLDEDWGAFLKEHGWLVGLSVDGPRELHDAYRVYRGGAPTFDRVLAAAKMLGRLGVPFNTLTCVHRLNARRPRDVYRFLRNELGSTYLQFIPIVEYKGFERTAPHTWDGAAMPALGSAQARPGSQDSAVTDWSVDPDDFGFFLCHVFDLWLKKDVGRVLLNHAETMVATRLGLLPQMCVYGEICGKGLAVEHDGSLYACDHFVYPEFRTGSVLDSPMVKTVLSPRQVKFGYDKSDALPGYCRACPHLKDCWGECPKNRFLKTPDGEPGLNYLCSGLRTFFAHAGPHADRLAAALASGPLDHKARMPGR